MISKKVGNLKVSYADKPPVVITDAKLKKQITAAKKAYSVKVAKAKKTAAKQLKNAKTAKQKQQIRSSLKQETKRLKANQKKAIDAKKKAKKKSEAKKRAYDFNVWLSKRDAYEIWLTHNAEKEKIQLPVNPEHIEVKMGSKNQSVDIAGFGEITIMGDRPAVRFSFKSFFPASEFPGMQVQELEVPIELAEKIAEWKESDSPVHFIVPGMAINLYCSIEQFDYTEKGGDVGTLEYTMSLKEFRNVKMRKVKVKNNKMVVNRGSGRNNNKTKPKTYKVKTGDTLYKIAKKIYGDGAQKTKLYNANKQSIPDKNKLKVGVVLKIP